MTINLPELFGSMAFNSRTMKERLPKDAYKALKRTIDKGEPLDRGVANVVANAMKDWAVEKGVTHYTHWFQPMNGVTAEKHDSFISPLEDGGVIMEFSGTELIKGEPDASSFPSGGLRATFEARGYTAWDPTSYAFIKDDVLCIPTAFCSYGGEALDEKTPLLRSMGAINTHALRVLKLFGTPCEHVVPTVGVEQEYFLIDRDVYNNRKDLIFTGRTLFGAKPPKGQELDDHYFGSIRIRVSAFMKDLNEELWKLGILAKTEHNEAAPAQHELAPIFSTCNVSVDHNQITMEIMRKVAKRHNLTCLLHEKPFAGVNGSGKHNNWSLTTDTGMNLLEPGDTPSENAQFLTFLCAVIKAIDTYQDLLRVTVATSGNDHRLGANEAPPAIVSMYIGEELEGILDALERGETADKVKHTSIKIGLDILPSIPRDTSDRNRTSPFAFTGNKFEFRMPGSHQSVAGSNAILNTIVADVLSEFADILEQAENFQTALNNLIRTTITKHKRIIFNGNGYDDSWPIEAHARGLSNYRSAAEAIPHLIDQHNIDVLAKHKVYSETELRSRCEILMESYCKQVNIEALVMIEMVRCEMLPSVIEFTKILADAIISKKAASANIACAAEISLLERISALSDCLYNNCEALDHAVIGVKEVSGDLSVQSRYYREIVFARMNELRAVADELETLVSKEQWPFPSYGRILYRV